MPRPYRRPFILLIALLIFLPLAQALPKPTNSVMIEMRDGTKLATDYFVPVPEEESTEAEAGDDQQAQSAPPSAEPPKYPTILVRTVYGRTGKVAQNVAHHVMQRGYAFVIQDTRGRGDSEGKDMAFADDGWGPLKDGVDTLEWVKAQPWCNGTIGTWGMSALGITQVLMAGATTDIACQSIGVASSNFYDHVSYQGGVFRKALLEGWLKGQGSLHVVDIYHRYPAYGKFWRQYNAEARASEITAPALHMGGWWDIFAQGTLRNFTSRQYEGGEGAKGNQKIIMGPWLHGPTKEPGDLILPDNFNFNMLAYEARFTDYWLKGEQNGIMDEPAINYYTIGDVEDPGAPGNEWRTANDWPPFPTIETAYYLTEAGGLTTEAPASTGPLNLTYTYDPEDPCPTHGGANLIIEAGPFDQSESTGRADVLTFATEPLTEPVEITGAIKAHLFVSTDAPDTDFTAKLIDIYPDGRHILMLDSIRRLKFRNGYEEPDPLEPGAIGELEIDLWSISLVFNKGHRIGLHVSSSNYPRFEKNPNTGEDFPGDEMRKAQNSVYMDQAHPSALLLPVRPAS